MSETYKEQYGTGRTSPKLRRTKLRAYTPTDNPRAIHGQSTHTAVGLGLELPYKYTEKESGLDLRTGTCAERRRSTRRTAWLVRDKSGCGSAAGDRRAPGSQADRARTTVYVTPLCEQRSPHALLPSSGSASQLQPRPAGGGPEVNRVARTVTSSQGVAPRSRSEDQELRSPSIARRSGHSQRTTTEHQQVPPLHHHPRDGNVS
jgi:hypothetical protein